MGYFILVLTYGGDNVKEYLKTLFKTVIQVYKGIIVALLYFGFTVAPLFLAVWCNNKWLLLGLIITLPISLAMFMEWAVPTKRR